MMRKLLIVLMATVLSGCLVVVSVDQPSNAVVGESFTVTVEIEAYADCATALCTPLFGVRLPVDWVVESCDYAGVFSGICSTASEFDSRFEDEYETTDPNFVWRAYQGDATALSSGDEVVVTWILQPTTPGEFQLDYAAGAQDEDGDLEFGDNQDSGFANPIRVVEPAVPVVPVPVPTLSLFGMLLLIGGLAVIVFMFKPAVGGHRVPLLAVGLALSGLGTLGGYSGQLHADESETLPDLNRANVELVILQLRQQDEVINLDDPKALLRSMFNLPSEFDERLEGLEEESLRAAMQTLLETDELDGMTCRISNTLVVCAD